MTLDEILEVLDRHHQRATYGAIAGLVGGIARGVLQGRPKDRRHSWIVSKESGMPTGYLPADIHPALEEREFILETPEELQEWLDTMGGM